MLDCSIRKLLLLGTTTLMISGCAGNANDFAMHTINSGASNSDAEYSYKGNLGVGPIPGPSGRLLMERRPKPNVLSYILPDVHATGCIYLSDGLYGIVYLYATNHLQHIGQLVSPSTYGWGVAATNTAVLLGTFSDTIDEYQPCTGKTPQKSLTGAGYGYPLGIAVTKQGTTFANEFPSNLIDVWGPNGKHRLTKDANESSSLFLAVDGQGNVYSAGWDTTGYHGIVDRCSKTVSDCATVVSGVHFPGGIAFDKQQNLYVNDQQYGSAGQISLYSGCANAKPACTLEYAVPYGGIGITALALGTNDRLLWTAARVSGSFCNPSSYYTCGRALGFLLPLTDGKIARKTRILSNTKPLGIAYWKPSPF